MLTGRLCVSVGVDTGGWAGRRGDGVWCFLLPPDVSIQILCPVSIMTFKNTSVNTLQHMPSTALWSGRVALLKLHYVTAFTIVENRIY